MLLYVKYYLQRSVGEFTDSWKVFRFYFSISLKRKRLDFFLLLAHVMNFFSINIRCIL